MSALPYSGAAGGVAASLTALCNAQSVNGIDFFLDTIQFTQQLQNAGIVITGEGALDAQTLEGRSL
ncbi:glycerate kinase [Niabella defluvii]|nr:glycerate kinase [Niabella sp. I65]